MSIFRLFLQGPVKVLAKAPGQQQLSQEKCSKLPSHLLLTEGFPLIMELQLQKLYYYVADATVITQGTFISLIEGIDHSNKVAVRILIV